MCLCYIFCFRASIDKVYHYNRSVSILNIVKSDENALPLRNTEASVSDKLDAVDDIIIDHSDVSTLQSWFIATETMVI